MNEYIGTRVCRLFNLIIELVQNVLFTIFYTEFWLQCLSFVKSQINPWVENDSKRLNRKRLVYVKDIMMIEDVIATMKNKLMATV